MQSNESDLVGAILEMLALSFLSNSYKAPTVTWAELNLWMDKLLILTSSKPLS